MDSGGFSSIKTIMSTVQEEMKWALHSKMITRNSLVSTICVGWTFVSLLYFYSQVYIVLGKVCGSSFLQTSARTCSYSSHVITDKRSIFYPNHPFRVISYEKFWRACIWKSKLALKMKAKCFLTFSLCCSWSWNTFFQTPLHNTFINIPSWRPLVWLLSVLVVS